MNNYLLQQLNWLQTLKKSFSDFLSESKNMNSFEIVDITTCEKTGNKQAVLKLHGHYSKTLYVKEIVADNQLINGLSQESVRALTYLSVIEQLAPEYHIANLELNAMTEDYIITIRSKDKKVSNKQSASIFSKNKDLIKKLNSLDANRIGYMAGVKDTVDEYGLAKQVSVNDKI
ncbi:MAG: hypothetical protein KBD25_00085 [Rickettsiaceae bacterium]|nr:hypothetical protein [Rickettsiaceae bacterium]